MFLPHEGSAERVLLSTYAQGGKHIFLALPGTECQKARAARTMQRERNRGSYVQLPAPEQHPGMTEVTQC